MAERSGYIGRHPGDGNSAIVRQTYSLTSETTELSFSAGYIVGYVDVYLNGVKLIDTQDYEATNASTIGLTTAAPSGDVVEVVAYKALSVGSVQKANNDFEVTNNTTLGGTVSVAGTSTLTGVVTTGGDLYVGGNLYGDGTNLTGVSTEYIDAASVTSSGIVTISNTTSSTSTTTGALIVSGGVGIAGSMFVGENVSIAGTLTYEDVTNIDSVGLITARLGVIATAGRGIQVTAGGVNVDAGIGTFDAGVKVAGGEFTVGSGATVLGSGNAEFVGIVTSNTCFKVGNGAFGAGIGATITGDGNAVFAGVATALTLDTTKFTAGLSTFSDDVEFVGSSNGITSAFWDNSTNTLLFKDSSYAKFGDSGDLSIYHDSSNSYIADTGTGDLRLRGSKVVIQNSGGTASVVESDGTGVELYYSNSKKFHTTNDGTVTTGIATATSIDAAIGLWILGADGTSHYTFTGIGLTVTTNDPTLELQRGQTYIFRNQSGGHPFRIQSTVNGSAGTAYNHGVTNNDGGNGTDITFAVPYNAPNILYYQCTSHANMGGVLLIGQRSVPILAKSAGYGVTAVDAGKTIYTDSDVTFPSGEFDPGDAISVVNNSGSSITLTQGSGLTLYNAADASTGSLTLAQRGMATVLYTTSSIAYGSGAGVS